MSDLDYTIIPYSISRTMDKAGVPLSDDQKSVLSGVLFTYQDKIARHGLESLVHNLSLSVEPPQLLT